MLHVFAFLILSPCRCHLDYAISVWYPSQERHTDSIESVQRRATKQIPSVSKLPYEERLRKLKLPSLKYRRIRGDMIEVNKILNQKYDKSVAQILTRLDEEGVRHTMRGHQHKLKTERPKTLLRKNYFSLRVLIEHMEQLAIRSCNSYKRK